MSHVILERCHYGSCSDIVDRSILKIKLDRHLVPTGSFFAAQFSDYVKDAYAKKNSKKL